MEEITETAGLDPQILASQYVQMMRFYRWRKLMPVFERSTRVGLGRNMLLSLHMEGALEGVGTTLNQLKSRLGAKTIVAPSQPQQDSSARYKSPTQIRMELERRNWELKQVHQRLASKDQQLTSKNQELASKDQELASKDQELASKDQELASKDRKIVELQNEIEGGLAIPPPHKIFLVAGTENASWFLESGEMAARSIRETLENNGLDIENFDSILEFGCGVGRIIRHWNTLEGPAIYGTDYNPDLIAWCKRNLPFAQFQVNSLDDMFEYEDQKFDFIYAWSVFTHLPEPQQFYWIDELSRGLRSGGYLFITTHGEHYLQHYGEAYRQHLLSTDRDRLEFLTAEHGEDWYRQYNLFSEEQTEQFRNGHLVIFGEDVAGTNQCNAFHPETYVRETLAKGFAVVDFIPGGGKGSYQDAYLMRKM